MIISPPFLLARNANETDAAWIDRCMSGGQPGDGAFPLSHALQWHGGMHLTEPEADMPVRAIADGDVVYLRQPTAQPAGPLPPEHPQAYRGGWTDNGVLVLRHQTEIGEGANASVTFFSIYMHLRQIEPTVRPGRRIYRKAALGRAGQIYGQNGQLHFEIVCDDTQLARLVGRASGPFPTGANGRTDAVFGELHFHLPAGALVFGEQPLHNNPVAHRQPLRAAGQRSDPPPVPLQAVHTTAEALFIGLRYAGGDGAAGNRGDATVSTYEADGGPIGSPLEENDAEYNLYTSATAISNAHPANARPAPSAVYELLRFGRVIGPDALTPADVPHWRRISYRGGTGWVNLNATGVTHFSDADFPHWTGWGLVDDSADQDSRCDSATVKGWLDASGDGKVTPAEATARMADAQVARKLARAVCKFPTEWNPASFDTRLGWLKTASLENPTPLDAPSFERLRAHVTSLGFWPGGMGLPESHWHWNPKAFIAHFRRCGWLSAREMSLCVPLLYQSNQTHRESPVVQSTISSAAAQNRVGIRNHTVFFSVCRRYLIFGSRLAHFLAQIHQETGVLRWAEELADGAEYEGRADLGNTIVGDGKRFKGRGLIQTTGRTNYEKYSTYRGKVGASSYSAEPNNLLLATNPFDAADAAGFYWASRSLGDGEININKLTDLGVDEVHLRRVTRSVNGAEDARWTGLVARRSHLKVASFVLLEDPELTSPERVRRDA